MLTIFLNGMNQILEKRIKLFKCSKKSGLLQPIGIKKGGHIMAMVRQLGIPTLFVTLSAAEARWPELLVILKKGGG